jgi:hypothetical protein
LQQAHDVKFLAEKPREFKPRASSPKLLLAVKVKVKIKVKMKIKVMILTKHHTTKTHLML